MTSASRATAWRDDAADWSAPIVTSPSPWDTSVNNTGSSSNSFACYQTMGFIIYGLVAGTLCILGLAGNTIAFVVLGGDGDMLPVAKVSSPSLSSSSVNVNVNVNQKFFCVALTAKLSRRPRQRRQQAKTE